MKKAGVVTENLDRLTSNMYEHLLKSRSDSTNRKYFSAFQRWEQFITHEGGSALPAEPIHVALYITKLIEENKSVSVIQSALYGIKWAHRVRGLSDPTDNHFVSTLFESAKRQNSRPVIKKDIVTSEQIISLCKKYDGTKDVLILRDLSMIVLCFSGFLRFDEVSSLKCADITFEENFLSLYISKSKTDQYRQGNKVLISEGESAACPIKLLRRYILEAGVSLESDVFLFRPAYRSGRKCALIYKNKPISYTRARETIVSRLREVCGDINLGLHSLRSGGASMAARSSVNERCWKRHGRWKGDVSKDGYVEDTIEHRLEVTKKLKL